jgi:hypothetical protein
VPDRAVENIDQVNTAIKAYYGDTLSGKVDPVANTVDGKDVDIHTFSDTSAYADELGGIAAEAQKYLSHSRTTKKLTGQKAVVFDQTYKLPNPVLPAVTRTSSAHGPGAYPHRSARLVAS